MTPLELPPGVVTTPTKNSNSANWTETQLMRWIEGKIQPIGGWEELAYSSMFASRVRAVHEWFGNDGTKYTAYLCEQHCYVDIAGTLTDISPTPAITPPYGDDIFAGGFGDGLFGAGTFGTPRPDVQKTKAITPCYKLGNWGEQLRAMTSADGRLLSWDPSTPATPLVPVTNAPTNNRTFEITPERFIILFGMGGDFRTFGWCDQEDDTNWNFADVASKAGFYNVEPASPIIDATMTRDGAIFHTAVKTHLVRFVGLPFVYSYEEIADTTTPLSAASIAATAIGSIWFTENGFWQYKGAVVAPIECPVINLVNDNIDWTYARYEAAAVNVSSFSELWFFYPSAGSRYNDKYVLYNYREGWWANGDMPRSCGFSSSYTTYPIMSDGEKVYFHEKGNLYPGANTLPFAETHVINIASGAGLYTMQQLLPDLDGSLDNLRFSFKYKNDRSRGVTKQSDKKAVRDNGYVDIRVTGRDMRMVLESVSDGVDPWTMGQTLFEATPRGQR
jgi:hypothetical protein